MNIRAAVNYHVVSDMPQAFQFDVDGLVGNLISPELVAAEVNVKDVREGSCSVSFNADGIVFTSAPSNTSRFDDSGEWQQDYDAEISQLLMGQTGALEVIVFDHTVRIDNPNATRKPARNVHNDYSPKGAKQRLIDLVGQQRASEFSNGEYGFVNVWRPIENPIITSPLGFIRPSSMVSADWMTIELIYPDRKGQILGVAATPKHEWFYQSHMRPDEVIIFNIYDNTGRPYLAHSALDVIGQKEMPLPRKSIETRTLVRYA